MLGFCEASEASERPAYMSKNFSCLWLSDSNLLRSLDISNPGTGSGKKHRGGKSLGAV